MAVLTNFSTYLDAFVDLYNAAVNNNRRRAEDLADTMTKILNDYNLFNVYGRDGVYATSLTFYQDMLILLEVDEDDPAWDVTTANLETFFGTTSLSTDNSFQSVTFANPLVISATTYKNWKCLSITGSTTINLTNSSNGDSGQIRITIDAIGGYTVNLGTMFTLKSGSTAIDVTANKTNIITWSNDGTDIIYTIDTASAPS